MPYVSKLATVLFLRKSHEDDATRELIEAKRLLALEEERLNVLNKKFRATLDDLIARQGYDLRVEEMTLYYQFMAKLHEDILAQTQKVLEQAQQCEEKRSLLETAVKDRKAVESVEAKREKRYLLSRARAEQAILDELGGQPAENRASMQ